MDVVLQCTPFIPEARAVLDLVDQCPEEVQKGKFPVIVIEGLDATGKRIVPFSYSSEINGSVNGAGIDKTLYRGQILSIR